MLENILITEYCGVSVGKATENMRWIKHPHDIFYIPIAWNILGRTGLLR